MVSAKVLQPYNELCECGTIVTCQEVFRASFNSKRLLVYFGQMQPKSVYVISPTSKTSQLGKCVLRLEIATPTSEDSSLFLSLSRRVFCRNVSTPRTRPLTPFDETASIAGRFFMTSS